ncbi:hypothetical protein TELCIR_07759 [Teladorsagia circumcincta]|uniref:Uncharacterized protein n=1 Tax=Teladorsagia circumcincta TaxID=45464 RepID=A0A2G9ULM7_TELCI|nr:hypothetical protein TELCIR_07759 [Teladorsagia circumcincta]
MENISTNGKANFSEKKVGTVLWCGSDVYLIIVAVFLVIFALFNFFGDTASKVSAALKLLLAIGFVVAVSYGVVKKDARIMAGVMIAALVLVLFDIIGIFVSIFGKSTIGETVTSIFFSLIRIAFLVHIFFIANKVRVAYKEEPSLPK